MSDNRDHKMCSGAVVVFVSGIGEMREGALIAAALMLWIFRLSSVQLCLIQSDTSYYGHSN